MSDLYDNFLIIAYLLKSIKNKFRLSFNNNNQRIIDVDISFMIFNKNYTIPNR